MAEILESTDPGRAKRYWTEAIGLLKEQGVVGYYEEPKTRLPRQGWAKEWLNQPLDIRPTQEGISAVIEIATRAKEANKRRKKTRGKKPELVA